METIRQPFACKLTASELKVRKATVVAELTSLVLERTELDNGMIYEFTGSDAVLDKLNDFIKIERVCCDFFTFHLTIHDDKVLLNIIGPEGAKAFLKTEIGL